MIARFTGPVNSCRRRLADTPLRLFTSAEMATFGGYPISRCTWSSSPLNSLSSAPKSVQTFRIAASQQRSISPLRILGFPELIATNVVYLEHLTSSIYVEREAEVFRYSLAFDQLRALALSADDSRARIKAQAATLS